MNRQKLIQSILILVGLFLLVFLLGQYRGCGTQSLEEYAMASSEQEMEQ